MKPTRLCFECEVPLSGTARKWCSESCRQRNYRKRNPDKSAHGKPLPVGKVEDDGSPRPTCENCGAQMRRTKGARFCGKSECRSARHRARMAEAPKCSEAECFRPSIGRGLCGPHYRRWYTSTPRYEYSCTHCEKVFTAGMRRSTEDKFCSVDCRLSWAVGNYLVGEEVAESRYRTFHQNYYGPKGTDVVLWSRPKRSRPKIVHVRGGGVWRDCACEICGGRYLTKNNGLTCSDICAEKYKRLKRREAKLTRRAVKKSAFVAPVSPRKIYVRDGFRCHICKGKLDMDAVAPHPESPTIDHVIPLAKGGTHEPANVAAAHFLCNSKKGDRVTGEQLMLIG